MPRLVDAVRRVRAKRGYPRMTVDAVTGAIYVYVRPGVVRKTKTCLSLDVVMDYDEDEKLLGVEILP